jgi:hypothetical protein
MQKMITPGKRTKQMWDQIVQKATGARTASGPVQRSNEPTVLLICPERSAEALRQDRFYDLRRRAMAQDARLAAAQAYRAAQLPGFGPRRPLHDPEAGLIMVPLS